jgi:carbonic anhydrase
MFMKPPANNRRRTLPMLALATMLAITAATEAQAARWITLGDNKQTKIEIDTASIDRSTEGKVRVWHRETYTPRRLQEAGAFSYSGLTQLTEFQCDKRLATPLRRIYLTESGTELKSESLEARDTSPVVPESPLEKTLTYACRPPAAKKPAEPAKPEVAPAPPPPSGKTGKRKGSKEEPPPPPPPKPSAPWSHEGRLGPDKWAKLDADYARCGDGKWQSPIDVRNAIRADLPPIRITYRPVPLQLIDDGHGIEANAADGGTITADGEEFELKKVRFHHPGEELADGKRAAMSVHFEHRSASGRIAIVAVPVQAGKEAHRSIRALWTDLPLEKNRITAPAGARFDPGQLLPAKREYVTYSGSLTRPPCTEGVLWLLMKQPVLFSREQIADFAKVYKSNVRPVQATNGRIVKESR